jgi:hypothetical protein
MAVIAFLPVWRVAEQNERHQRMTARNHLQFTAGKATVPVLGTTDSRLEVGVPAMAQYDPWLRTSAQQALGMHWRVAEPG